MANNDNLVSLADRTKKEQREIARKGGIASGKIRQEKATMKKTLELLLDEVADIKGNENNLTYKQLTTLGLMQGAIEGKAENYKTILQLLGELQEQENNETPVVNINIVDNTNLESALYEDK